MRSQCRDTVGAQSDWSSGVTTGSTSPAGGLFGATLGFNGQSGAFVFGAEGDIAGNWMRDSNSIGTGFVVRPVAESRPAGLGPRVAASAMLSIAHCFTSPQVRAFGDVQMMTNGGTATADRAGWTAGAGPRICNPRPMVGENRISLCRPRQRRLWRRRLRHRHDREFQYEYHPAWRELSILVTRRTARTLKCKNPGQSPGVFLMQYSGETWSIG